MSIPEPENSPLSFHDFPSLEIEGSGPLDSIFKERGNIGIFWSAVVRLVRGRAVSPAL